MSRFIEGTIRLSLGAIARLGSCSALRRIRNMRYFTDFTIHEKMLADRARTEPYALAISKHVNEGDVVVDVGTGTGILAFLAHRQRPAKLYAIDHSAIIEVAKQVAAANAITGIDFIKTNSRAFKPAEQLDAIIHEQMGSWLFNENMVDSVLDLRDRLLKPGGRIIPGRFELFFEPTQLRPGSRLPFIWEQSVHDVSFACLREREQSRRVDELMIMPCDVDRLLCEPEPILSFDLHTLKDSGSLAGLWNARRTVVSGGELDGFCLYFKAWFDQDTMLDTTPPGHDPFYSSWRIPFYRAQQAHVAPGAQIAFSLEVPDIARESSWTWSHSIHPAGTTA